MNKQILIASVALFALVCALQLSVAQAGLGDMLASYFEEERVTRCPVPGDEYEFEGKVTIKVLNTPKERCKEVCAAKQLESIVGSEQRVYGPRLVCCCKTPGAEQ